MPKSWTRDELLIAMNVYARMSFGQLHSRQPLIIKVANRMGRTPGSLAMKLCNLASFDPQLKARGVSGLKGASRLDKEVWDSFEQDWEERGVESERKYQVLMRDPDDSLNFQNPTSFRDRPTETQRETTQRLGQEFFRRIVLVSYHHRCCITRNPIPELLTASHIVGWAQNRKHRLNPRNGLCLAKTQDAAFDRHLITLDENMRIIVSKSIKEHFDQSSVRENFARFEGKQIDLPERFLPEPRFLELHRKEFATEN